MTRNTMIRLAVATAFALAMLLMLARVVVMPLARLERAARSLAGGGSAGSERKGGTGTCTSTQRRVGTRCNRC